MEWLAIEFFTISIYSFSSRDGGWRNLSSFIITSLLISESCQLHLQQNQMRVEMSESAVIFIKCYEFIAFFIKRLMELSFFRWRIQVNPSFLPKLLGLYACGSKYTM